MAYLSSWKNEKITSQFDKEEYRSMLAEKIKNSAFSKKETEKAFSESEYLSRWKTKW